MDALHQSRIRQTLTGVAFMLVALTHCRFEPTHEEVQDPNQTANVSSSALGPQSDPDPRACAARCPASQPEMLACTSGKCTYTKNGVGPVTSWKGDCGPDKQGNMVLSCHVEATCHMINPRGTLSGGQYSSCPSGTNLQVYNCDSEKDVPGSGIANYPGLCTGTETPEQLKERCGEKTSGSEAIDAISCANSLDVNVTCCGGGAKCVTAAGLVDLACKVEE